MNPSSHSPGQSLVATACFFVAVMSFPYYLPVSVACTFVFFFSVTANEGFFARFLPRKPMLWLGKISDSIYLVHPFVIDPFRLLLSHARISPVLRMLAFVSVAPVAAIAFSALSHHFVEYRLTRLISGAIARR